MKKDLSVHFSSESEEWETPKGLFAAYDRTYQFDLDVCASAENAKCTDYFDRYLDGLSKAWHGRSCWMNPPYGRGITGKWVKKAYEESQLGTLVVCLLPARTDTKWFHEYCLKGEIRFLKGRLKFGNAKHSAPFPSMIVIFDGLK